MSAVRQPQQKSAGAAARVPAARVPAAKPKIHLPQSTVYPVVRVPVPASAASSSDESEQESNVFQVNREFARKFNKQAEETELVRSTCVCVCVCLCEFVCVCVCV